MSQRLSVLADKLYQSELRSVLRRRDRGFMWLMAAEWLGAVVVALWLSDQAWAGKVAPPHAHLTVAVVGGGLLSVPPMLLALWRPGWTPTRHVMAVAQMLWSALFIHLTAGRIETHFHIFGSLAYLAFYRDWQVLLTGTVVVICEHVSRGLASSVSMYGMAQPEFWRVLEHVFWVLFEDLVLLMGVLEVRRDMKMHALRQAEMLEFHNTIEDKVIDRTQELKASREQYRLLVETTQTVPWRLVHGSWSFSYVGPQGPALLGCSPDAWLVAGFFEDRLHDDDRAATLEHFAKSAHTRGPDREFRLRRDDGSWVWVRGIISATDDSEVEVRGVFLDVTKERQLEFELQQAQKLESVGRLASGIAHEINTPVQFVNDSLHFVREAFHDALRVIGAYGQMRRAAASGEGLEQAVFAAGEAEQAADLDYLVENVPKALDRSMDGLSRITTLVRSMKEFAHPDQKTKTDADLNRAIETTLIIAKSEYKYVADLVLDLGPLPPVSCHIGELNQVFLNLVVNAAHAIGDVVAGTDHRGQIKVVSRAEGSEVVVAVSDTGAGIPEAVRAKIFEPFFTTKQVGKGTGQGLAIARSVVVEKHGGTLTFETAPGRGTSFFIRIPITQPAPLKAKAA